MTLLLVNHVTKTYPGTLALDDVSLEVQAGEIVCLLGPSGCGKTTLLRVIAGLERPDSGSVWFAGEDLATVPVHQRGFGLMFQEYALFPHKNVFDNVAFGLRMQRLPRPEVERGVAEALSLVGLQGFEGRDVSALSGGERQRVALARSLAPRPRLLMLDEPLGSLDRTLRERLMHELRAILKSVGVTAIYVTHDQEEAFAIADQVIVMNRGRVIQVGTPEGVYRRPTNAFVARFLGLTNLLPGRVVATTPEVLLDTPVGTLSVSLDSTRIQPGDRVMVLIRPEGARRTTSEGPNVIPGRLVERSFRGGHYRVVVQPSDGHSLTFELDLVGTDVPEPGQLIYIALPCDAITTLI